MYNRLGEQKGQRELWAMTWEIHLNLPIKVLCEQTRELTHDFLDYV